MTHIINLILIQILITNLIDISGFIESVKTGIGKLLHIPNTERIKLKPFDCSYCMNFWIGMAYLFYTNSVELSYIAFVLFLSFLTDLTITIQYTIKDIMIDTINFISNLFVYLLKDRLNK